jgi:hypothetical protein
MPVGNLQAQVPSRLLLAELDVLCNTSTPSGFVLATMVAHLPDQNH